MYYVKKVDFRIFVGRKIGKRTIYAITVSLLLFGMITIRCQAEEETAVLYRGKSISDEMVD